MDGFHSWFVSQLHSLPGFRLANYLRLAQYSSDLSRGDFIFSHDPDSKSYNATVRVSAWKFGCIVPLFQALTLQEGSGKHSILWIVPNQITKYTAQVPWDNAVHNLDLNLTSSQINVKATGSTNYLSTGAPDVAFFLFNWS